jgi:hypothetical protein
MNFIRAIQNNEDLILDEEVDSFLAELEQLEDLELLDEDAWNRIAKRVEVRDLALYRYIVGANNLMLTKKFLDLAREGKSIPSTMVKAYLPAIEMLDDIVTAGPGYVQLLKTLHKRAKNSI